MRILIYTVISRELAVSAKFCTCTVVSVNGTLVEDKMHRFKGECAHFNFKKCPIYTDNGASAILLLCWGATQLYNMLLHTAYCRIIYFGAPYSGLRVYVIRSSITDFMCLRPAMWMNWSLQGTRRSHRNLSSFIFCCLYKTAEGGGTSERETVHIVQWTFPADIKKKD